MIVCIHIFLQVLEITREMVTHAKTHTEDIEFSAEDALRSDPDFLAEVYSVAIAAGATTINVSLRRLTTACVHIYVCACMFVCITYTTSVSETYINIP